jgi:cell division GTPase FtsZ
MKRAVLIGIGGCGHNFLKEYWKNTPSHEWRINAVGADFTPKDGMTLLLDKLDALPTNWDTLDQYFRDADSLAIVGSVAGVAGSALIPALLSMAKLRGLNTVAVLIVPFEFEGKDRNHQARRLGAGVQMLADGFVDIRNDIPSTASPKESLLEYFRKLNQ